MLLDNTPETETKTYLSKLISLGIYNFTKNADGINYLLVIDDKNEEKIIYSGEISVRAVHS